MLTIPDLDENRCYRDLSGTVWPIGATIRGVQREQPGGPTDTTATRTAKSAAGTATYLFANRVRFAAKACRDARMEQKLQFRVRAKNRENLMDRTTRCQKCGKRMVPVVTISGRTDLQCISCDDPAVNRADSPLTVPEKPIVLERV